VDEYVGFIRKQNVLDEVDVNREKKEIIHQMISQYVKENLSPDPETKQHRRIMMLFFYGENAVQKLRDEVVGHITSHSISGETIRDTYGDFVLNKDQQVKYFEPAVLLMPTQKGALEEMAMWAKYSDADGGLLENVVKYPADVKPEKVLVLIKPDNFQRPTSRVGNIIDMFSRTGLYIIGARLIQMSIDQAMEFYGPVKQIFHEKMKAPVKEKLKGALHNIFEFSVQEDTLSRITNELTPLYAEHEFNKIITFMTGLDASKVTDPAVKKGPGKEKCLALVYQGKDAVAKIRGVLGLTDPNRAAPNTVRREFGQNILVNAAHASDSTENAEREMKIINIKQNDLKPLLESYIKGNLETVRLG
jgi:nucleoside diphosphate kinase